MGGGKGTFRVALVWFFGVAVVWELGAWVLANLVRDPMAASRLPYLHAVFRTAWDQADHLFSESLVTLSHAAYGFAAGAAVGIVLAILMSVSRIVESISFPYLIFLQMIPVLGLAPIVFGIVRDEYAARVLIAAYITFFPVAIGMLGGMKSVEKEKRDFMHLFAASRWDVYTKLLIPASLPNLFNSLKATAPLSVTAAILVELMGAQSGIGVLMLRNLYYGAPQVLSFWATVFVSAMLGVASYLIIVLLEWLFIPHRRVTAQKAGS